MVARMPPYNCPPSHHDEEPDDDDKADYDDERMRDPSLGLHEDARAFLLRLDLPRVHPHCTPALAGQPPPEHPSIRSIDPATDFDHSEENLAGALHTLWAQAAPAVLAMSELWLRLFAAVLAPLALVYLLTEELSRGPSTAAAAIAKPSSENDTASSSSNSSTQAASVSVASSSLGSEQKRRRRRHALACVVGVASSAVVLTDSLFVLANDGRSYGLLLLVSTSVLSVRSCLHLGRYRLLFLILVPLFALTGWLLYHSAPQVDAAHPQSFLTHPGLDAPLHISEGLYHSSDPTIEKIVEAWDEEGRAYDKGSDATPWLPTGDSRTGIPFLVNAGRIKPPEYHRVWLQTEPSPRSSNPQETEGGEVLALDIAFPTASDDDGAPLRPVFLVLHGLNGGSHEDYVMDFTNRRTAEGSIVVVMVARGLMDAPLRGWDVFHGARIADVEAAAKAVRRALPPAPPDDDVENGMKTSTTTLAGVGYSMGAIILSHYVAASGPDCALDAAMAVSGGLDMRQQLNFYRSMRLWQPMLAKELKDAFILGKFERRYRKRLSSEHFTSLLRSTHITSIDEDAVVTYNGFNDLTHYYSSMSAMGDLDYNRTMSSPQQAITDSQISNVSIPFCVLHALDDPLVSWRTIVPPPLEPQSLADSGSGRLLLLLTKGGGHVGWPLGMLPHTKGWEWMNNAARDFVLSVQSVRRSEQISGQEIFAQFEG